MKIKMIKLEQEFEDCKHENARLKNVMAITEERNQELREIKGQLESQVENKNESSSASVDNLLKINQALTAEKQVMAVKLEKLRKVSAKVPELQQEIETLRNSKMVFDKSKQQLISDRTELEEEKFEMTQKLEKLQKRFDAIDKELDQAKLDNMGLQRQLKLQSAQVSAEKSDSIEQIKLNAEKDTNTLLNVKFKLEKEVAELKMKLLQKEDERDKRETLLKRKFEKEITQANEEFETALESLQHDLDKAKYANVVLENHMHELRLD